jgi:hypothetical protein
MQLSATAERRRLRKAHPEHAPPRPAPPHSRKRRAVPLSDVAAVRARAFTASGGGSCARARVRISETQPSVQRARAHVACASESRQTPENTRYARKGRSVDAQVPPRADVSTRGPASAGLVPTR